jgi:hypothetical protein
MEPNGKAYSPRTRQNPHLMARSDLSGADLRGAKCWDKKQLRDAESLQGATMPDSQKLKSDDNPDGPTLEEWLKSKNRRKNGENCDPS